MKKNKKFDWVKYLFSIYFFSLVVFLILVLVFFPAGLMFIFIDRFSNDPFNLLNIFDLFMGLVILPIAQIFWFIVCISILDPEKPFTKALDNNQKEVIQMIFKIHKDLWVKKGKK